MSLSSKEMMKIAYNALDDKKGINIKVIDISEVSSLADYFIVASGQNHNQVQALSDNVFDELSKEGCKPKQTEGYNTASWILLDYGDIVVHVFNKDDRFFYDIERIWKDGKEVEF